MLLDNYESALLCPDIKTFERLEGAPYYKLPELDEIFIPHMFSGDKDFKAELRELRKLKKAGKIKQKFHS